MISIKPPCSRCFLSGVDRNNLCCQQCEARLLYAAAVQNWETYTGKEQAAAVKKLEKLVPTYQSFTDSLTPKPTQPIQTEPKKHGKPKLQLSSFRAFHRAARKLGYKNIKSWLEKEYLRGHCTCRYLQDIGRCAQPTVNKILRAYGMPGPGEHNRPAKMANLDHKKVYKMLEDNVKLGVIAKDQGCSVGLINQFKRDYGFAIKRYNKRG